MTVPFAVMRHASTAWNAERRLQGMTDTPLSPVGEAEAKRWRLPSPAATWQRQSSPLQRARRTAELMRPAAAVTTCWALREMSFGIWEGYTVAELRAQIGQPFIAEERKGIEFHPPGGESPRMVMARIAAWAKGLDEPVVAISHKATLRALLALATGWDMTVPPPHRLDWRCLHYFETLSDGTIRIAHLNVPVEP